ncbi:MAG: hypothetical protein ACFB00_08535 [Parvularculaceae bacterium]
MSANRIIAFLFATASVAVAAVAVNEAHAADDPATASAYGSRAAVSAAGAYSGSHAATAAAAAIVSANLAGAVADHGRALGETVSRRVEADIAARVEALNAAEIKVWDLED